MTELERALEHAATALDTSRRLHKRAIREHRAQAKVCAEQLSDLRKLCERYGIKLILNGEGGTHGRRSHPQSQH
jgi:thiamine monophosphate synthase